MPDNEPPLALFKFMSTQWRTGAGGPTGLDYGVMYQRMARLHLAPEEYDDLESDVRVMESAALNCIYAKP